MSKAQNKKVSDYSSWQMVKDILPLIKPYRGRFILASVARFLGDFAWLYAPFAYAYVITFLTQYKPGDSLSTLWLAVGLWWAAAMVRTASQYISKYYGYLVAERVALDATLATVRHMFALDMVWHEKENSGNKIKKAQNVADGLNKVIRIWFDSIIEIVINLIAINIVIASFDTVVLIMTLIFLVTYFAISGVMSRRARDASHLVNDQEEEVTGLLFEGVSNIRTVKVMGMAKSMFGLLTDSVQSLFNKLQRRIFWYQSRNGVLFFWAMSFKLGIIALIVNGIIHGQYEIGFLVIFNSYITSLRQSIDELSNATLDFVISRGKIARMKEILSLPVTIDDEKGKVALAEDWQKIRVEHVSFAYGGNTVLEDISFEVKRGEKVGIVGLSGAGKSTLFKLLLKEREEFSGDITFDDISLKKIRTADYFKQVSVVLQDTEVFNFSLKDNITITNSKEQANKKLLEAAIATSHIEEVIEKLPQGIDTLIGEKGVKLSGGERQRLGIARAIFKDPQILLLDEATSHLDLESEEKIRDSLHKFFENVTAIVIAHRLTTIREMDKILVIEDGKILESGNFEELQAKRGRFYDLWEKQRL